MKTKEMQSSGSLQRMVRRIWARLKWELGICPTPGCWNDATGSHVGMCRQCWNGNPPNDELSEQPPEK